MSEKEFCMLCGSEDIEEVYSEYMLGNFKRCRSCGAEDMTFTKNV